MLEVAMHVNSMTLQRYGTACSDTLWSVKQHSQISTESSLGSKLLLEDLANPASAMQLLPHVPSWCPLHGLIDTAAMYT